MTNDQAIHLTEQLQQEFIFQIKTLQEILAVIFIVEKLKFQLDH